MSTPPLTPSEVAPAAQLAAAPSTPPRPPTKIKLTLPTPPSFSMHRRTQSINSSPSDTPGKKKGHNRSVSFSQDVEVKTMSPEGKPVYRIPQRVTPTPLDYDVSPRTRKGPPSPLQLGAARTGTGHAPLRSPFGPGSGGWGGPKTAPAPSRLASTAAARGLSIDPALTKQKESKRSSAQGLVGHGSLWSAGLTSSGGWITPGLGSAKSATSASAEAQASATTIRQRGLSVAVLKDGKEMLVDSGPITPGLPSARRKSIEAVKPDSEHLKAETETDVGTQPINTPASVKPKEGDLAALPPSPSVDPTKLRMLSPTRSPDYTMGTFSQAQDEKLNPDLQAKTLSTKKDAEIDELVSQAQPGETVVLASASGAKMVGTVYYMSGGGKGPAGKSKAKYKTVKCRDFDEGYCAYGDSCSFIHEDHPNGENKKDAQKAKAQLDEKPKPKSTSAWSRGPPKFPGTGTGAGRKERLSAFAAPYSTKPLVVDPAGAIKPAEEISLPLPPPQSAVTLPTPSVMSKKSAWSKGPPISVKTVRVPSPDELQLQLPSARPIPTPDHAHLIPPSSAWTASSTEDDADPRAHVHVPAPAPAAAYPWGMPMSPLQPQPQAQADFPTGPGVLWTPSGWAVQDAAMKWAMMGVEQQLQLQMHGKVPHKAKNGMKNYYRKRPCKFYAEGHCPHGDACTYLHVLPTANASLHRTSDSDSTTATPSSVVSKTAPTLPCKFFNSQGGCQNGDSCSFLHTFVIPPGAQPVARPRPWRTRPCRHYQLAKCNLGDACHFAHVADPHFPLPPGYERTLNMTGELCYEGVCSRGQLCRFVHYRPPVQKEPGAEDHSLTEGRVEALRQLVKTASHSDDDSEEGEDEDEDEDEIQIVTAETSISA